MVLKFLCRKKNGLREDSCRLGVGYVVIKYRVPGIRIKTMITPDNSRLVYSSEHGKMCSKCSKPLGDCVCDKLKRSAVPDAGGPARVRYDTQGRKGKGMTIISGLPLNREKLEALCGEVKRRLGAGGTVKDFTIELQGDRREEVARFLSANGYDVKLSGLFSGLPPTNLSCICSAFLL